MNRKQYYNLGINKGKKNIPPETLAGQATIYK